jgi:hypothetical protein
MTKILEASCENQVVTVDDLPVDDTPILSEGVAASEGFTFLDGNKRVYIPKTSPDLKTTLTQLVDALDNISSALSALDSAGFLIAATAGVPSPPVASGDISALNDAKTALNNLKDNLR